MQENRQEEHSESREQDDISQTADSFLRIARTITIVAILLALSALIFFTFNFFGRPIPVGIEKWGQAGDYMGGLINPIVGLATVLLIFLGIHIQRGELRATERQLKTANKEAQRQSFEQSLFSWLSTYQSLLSAIKLSTEYSGRAALTRVYKRNFTGTGVYSHQTEADRLFEERSGEPSHPGLEDLVSAAPTDEVEFKNLTKLYCDAQKSFNGVYSDHISDLDALFRTLYRLLRWIDETRFTQTEKWHYVALVRAQLSWIELVYLLYNSLNLVGHQFAALANKYAIFDNLNVEPDLLLLAIKEQFSHRPPVIPGLSWSLEPRAFNSAEAKAKLGISATA